MGSLDAGVGDPAGGVRGLQAERRGGAGNWLASVDERPDEAAAVLRDALEDEEPLVREHAAWALERAVGR